MARGLRWLLPSLLVGCADPAGDDPPPDTDTDTDAAPDLPDLPVATCHEAPYAWVAEPLGELLDHRPRRDLSISRVGMDLVLSVAELDALRPTPEGVEVHRFRYTTQDRGEVVEATGLVGIPSFVDGPAPVVLLVHSFSGLDGVCAPSNGRIEEAIETALVTSRGFVVIAPDLIGLDGTLTPDAPHAPMVGEQVAVGAWDGWRAGRALLEGDLAHAVPDGLRDDVVVWGFSQGGHGALFVDRYAPWLAPGVEVAAVVAGTPPLDLRGSLVGALADWNDSTGLTALIMAGMHRWYAPEVPLSDAFVDAPPHHVATRIADEVLGTPDVCEAGLDVGVRAVEDLFTPRIIDAVRRRAWDEADPWGCYLTTSSLPTTPVPAVRAAPTLVVFGTDDTLVPAETQLPGVDELCAGGARMEVLTCEGADHAYANLWSIPEQEAWVRDRLAGVPPAPGCAIHPPAPCAGTPTDAP